MIIGIVNISYINVILREVPLLDPIILSATFSSNSILELVWFIWQVCIVIFI